MSRLRCLIVDDEPLARQLLAEYVGKVSFLELHATCAGPLAALDILRTTPIELLLLDVHMPELTGLELLSTLAHPPLVILTTAHSQYALQGFEVNAVDYLLKPITFERFLRAAHKAGDRWLSPAAPPAEPEFLFIKDGAQQHKVNLLKCCLSKGCAITWPYTPVRSALSVCYVLRFWQSSYRQTASRAFTTPISSGWPASRLLSGTRCA